MNQESAVNVMARIVARPEAADQVQAALVDLVGHTRDEAGCMSYRLYRRADAVGEFMTVEQWRSRRDADAHMTTAHVAAAIAKVGALLAQPPEINRYELLR